MDIKGYILIFFYTVRVIYRIYLYLVQTSLYQTYTAYCVEVVKKKNSETKLRKGYQNDMNPYQVQFGLI